MKAQKNERKLAKMAIDIIIMSYVILMAFLVRLSENIPKSSLKIVLIGLLFSPIIGFVSYFYFQRT